MTVVLADPSLYRYTGGEPPTEEDLVHRYSSQVAGHSHDGSQRWINLVVALDEQPIGYVQVTTPTGGDATEIVGSHSHVRVEVAFTMLLRLAAR